MKSPSAVSAALPLADAAAGPAASPAENPHAAESSMPRHFLPDSRPMTRWWWLSPGWSRIVGHAKRSEEGLGLRCDFTFGMAWPYGDSQVPEEDADCRSA